MNGNVCPIGWHCHPRGHTSHPQRNTKDTQEGTRATRRATQVPPVKEHVAPREEHKAPCRVAIIPEFAPDRMPIGREKPPKRVAVPYKWVAVAPKQPHTKRVLGEP